MTLEGFTEPWPRGLTLFYLWPARDGDRKVETKSIFLRWLISWGPWVSQAPWWCPWRNKAKSLAAWLLEPGSERLRNAYTWYYETQYWQTWCFTDTALNLNNGGNTQNCTTIKSQNTKNYYLSFLHIYIHCCYCTGKVIWFITYC